MNEFDKTKRYLITGGAGYRFPSDEAASDGRR